MTGERVVSKNYSEEVTNALKVSAASMPVFGSQLKTWQKFLVYLALVLYAAAFFYLLFVHPDFWLVFLVVSWLPGLFAYVVGKVRSKPNPNPTDPQEKESLLDSKPIKKTIHGTMQSEYHIDMEMEHGKVWRLRCLQLVQLIRSPLTFTKEADVYGMNEGQGAPSLLVVDDETHKLVFVVTHAELVES